MIGDLTSVEIEEILRKGNHGHLACVVNGELYVVPIFFAYKNGFVYGHTYEGKKVDMMRQNPEVCFQTDATESLWNWKSVVTWGTYEELTGENAIYAVKLLSGHLNNQVPKGEYHIDVHFKGKSHYNRQNHRLVILYRIKLAEKTGRFESTRSS